ncbi:MAG: hypothetical protein IKG08_00875 [Eubacterium sp.]|nr:hypothetical protein [Eubacterium sp.]
MRKIKKLLAICAAAVCALCAVSVAAAPKDDLLSYVKEKLPAAYQEVAYPQVEKIVNQLDVTEDQYNAVKGIIDDVVATVSPKGMSLHEYSAEEQNYLLGKFKAACDALGLTYKLVSNPNALHKGDQSAEIYKDGVKIGTLEFDVEAAKTDSSVTSGTWGILIAAIAICGAAVVVSRKRRVAA